MRVRLHGGTTAGAGVIEEEEGSDDGGGDDDDDDVYKVVTSVASAEEVREDAMRAAEGEAVGGSRAISAPSSEVRKCESVTSVKATATSGRMVPEGKRVVFTVLSSDIGNK